MRVTTVILLCPAYVRGAYAAVGQSFSHQEKLFLDQGGHDVANGVLGNAAAKNVVGLVVAPAARVNSL